MLLAVGKITVSSLHLRLMSRYETPAEFCTVSVLDQWDVLEPAIKSF
jgi:hypothetical protein